MKNEPINPQNDIIQYRKKLQEKLTIIENQRKIIIRKRRKKKLNNVLLFVLLPAVFVISVFIGYKFFNNKFNNSKNKLSEIIALKKERVFRDSVNLIAMELKITNEQNKHFIYSLNSENTKNNNLSIQENKPAKKVLKTTVKKTISQKKHKKTVSFTYTKADDIINFLKEEKLNSEAQQPAENITPRKDINKATNEKLVNKPVSETKPVIFATYNGCENKSTSLKRKKCLDNKILKHIKRHINKRIFKNSGVGTINVLFTITDKGSVKVLKINGAINEFIKKEVLRVMESLPRFIPARSNNANIAVNHSISFEPL